MLKFKHMIETQNSSDEAKVTKKKTNNKILLLALRRKSRLIAESIEYNVVCVLLFAVRDCKIRQQSSNTSLIASTLWIRRADSSAVGYRGTQL